jgi:murein DD-endopeptidase MepM/ murein hydrolase activator NlpD
VSNKPRLILSISICLALTTPLAAPAASTLSKGAGDSHNHAEARQKLKEIEKNRKENAERLRRVREQEQRELIKLHRIKQKLNETQGALFHNQNSLDKTTDKIKATQNTLASTKTQEETIAEQAGIRLREIYEGQRLGLIEMIFQVSSLQTLLDLFYYQERIADSDRELLNNIKQKEAALAFKKNQLDSKKNLLGDLVSEFARKALRLNREKDDQEEVAEQLRKQRAYYEQAESQLATESVALERQIVDLSHGKGSKNLAHGSGTMSMPLHAPVTSPFGWRRHPIFGVRKFHTGVDLAGANHSPIHTADSGNVLFSGYYGGYGKVVIVDHGKGMATLYAHMSKVAVAPGQNVQKGEVVGYEGTTGFSTGPHLHFEVRVDGKPNNPLNFVR